MEMLPPSLVSSAVVPSDVRSDTLTVTEFLAVNGDPPLASSFRLCPFASLASFSSSHVNTRPGYNHLRIAHSSSRNNEKYEPIHPETLTSISTDHIEKFRKYITSMSPHVAFGSAHRTPFDGCALTNEADVTAYVTMEVIVAAWLAVQQMIPRHQDFYLTTIRQLVLPNGVPDQVFGYVKSSSGSDFTPSAIIELKAPNMVLGLLSVIGIDLVAFLLVMRLYDAENRRARRHIDPTADWAKITRQLRKYVIDSAALDIIVMDEGTAIYFAFPPDSTVDSDPVSYAVATSGTYSGPAMTANPLRITLRELVAFMCLRSLVRVGIQPRDFTEGSMAAVDAGDATVFVVNHDSRSQKRPPPDTFRRAAPKRVRHQPQTDVSNAVTFTGWRVNELVTLTSTSNLRAHSRDSGFHEVEFLKRRDYHSPFTTAGETAIIYRVQEIFTFAVAVLSPHGSSSSSTNIVAKIPYSVDHLNTELHAYQALSPLQGDCVPYCYGTGAIDGHSVLLTEYIAPGITIASLESSCGRSRAVALKASALAALQSIHGCGVIHKDACGRNLLVCGVGEDEKVVVADFDIARVYEGEYKTIIELRAWQDRAFVNDAFVRME